MINEKKINERIISRKQGFFICGNAPFKEQDDFRKNALNAKKAEKLFNENKEIKYAVGKGFILIDCDDITSVKAVEDLLIKLNIKTYSYETSKNHKHFWFKVDDERQKLIDMFKLNSSTHKLSFHTQIDTRSFRKNGKKVLQGQVFLKNNQKSDGERPTPIQLINNLYSENISLCPVILLIPYKQDFVKLSAYPIDTHKYFFSGMKQKETRYNWEFQQITNFKSLKLGYILPWLYINEMITYHNDFKHRGLVELDRVKTSYLESADPKIINLNKTILIDDENEFEIDSDEWFEKEKQKAFEIYKLTKKQVKNTIQATFKPKYFNKDIWLLKAPTDNNYFNFSDHHTDKKEINRYFFAEIKDYFKDKKIDFQDIKYKISVNNKGIYKYAVLSPLNDGIKEILFELKMIKNSIFDIQDSVVCLNAYIVQKRDENGRLYTFVDNDMSKAPFTVNKIKRNFIPNLKRSPLLNRFLFNLFKTEENIDKVLNLLSFSIANYNSAVLLVLTGSKNCGKGTLERLINEVIGEHNVASMDGDKVFEGSQFALGGIVNKLFGTMNEKSGVVDKKANNIVKKLIGDEKYLNGVNVKYKKAGRTKSSCSFAIFSNDIIQFDITDNAVMSRLCLIDRIDYDESKNLTTAEFNEMMCEDTYNYLFMEFFKRQTRLFLQNKTRNRDYIIDNDEYIKKIIEINPTFIAIKSFLNRPLIGELLSKTTLSNITYPSGKTIPFLVVKTHLEYLGYKYDSKKEIFTKGSRN